MTEIKDTLERMIAAERQAKEIVDDAERRARQVIDDAHRQADEILAKAREEARDRASGIIADAIARGSAEKQQRLEAVKKKLESLPDEIAADRKEKAIEVAVRAVLGVQDEPEAEP